MCLPVVDGRTSLAAFTDVHTTKIMHLLNTPLAPAGTLRSALILPCNASYYHFLVYRLSALILLRSIPPNPALVLATTLTMPASVAGDVESLIAEMGADHGMTRRHLDNGVYDVENVVVPQNRNPWFGAYFARTVMLPHLARRAALPGPIEHLSPLKLFVRRNAATRRLANHDDIESWHVGRGYTPMDPGALAFHEQALLFARATHIVGVEGAAMTNLIFALRAQFVVILANPATVSDTFFSDLLERFDVTVRTIAGQGIGPSPEARTSDFIVPLAAIAAVHGEDDGAAS